MPPWAWLYTIASGAVSIGLMLYAEYRARQARKEDMEAEKKIYDIGDYYERCRQKTREAWMRVQVARSELEQAREDGLDPQALWALEQELQRARAFYERVADTGD